MTRTFNVRLSHKSYCFVRTESRFFEVSESRILANGLVLDAIPVPDSTVVDLLAQAQASSTTKKQKPRGKASSIQRFRKETV
ncbi:MAG: hypothetical protein ACRD5J_14665 [Nitrososphaeraceae archaeon]